MVQGRPEDYLERHPGPGDVLCVIEVADSSLRSDRTIKQSIYAAAGIAQLIIVNLIDSRIEVYEDPNVTEKCYGLVRILHRGDTISLLLADGRTLGVPVTEWLPEAGPAKA